MPTLTLKAHFDGKQVRLDEPHNLQPGTALTVTLHVPAGDEDSDWTTAAAQSLARAYSDDEPEYTLADVKK